MRRLLVGIHGLVLIHFAATGNSALSIAQKPRFYGVQTGRFVNMYCMPSVQHKPARVEWYKSSEYNVPVDDRQILDQAKTSHKGVIQNAILNLYNLGMEDTGVYFCKINNTWGLGTGLQVARSLDRNQVAFRSNMKDGFIILQALLLTVCAAAFLHRNRKLVTSHLDKRDSIYEEPETDHIYEGLAIESCAEGFYEELSVYAQVEDAEAPWE